MPRVKTPKAVERWLDEGWSPARIALNGTAFVITVATVAAYATQAHHPGAVWWLLIAVAVIAVWTFSEMLRWRIRHNRIQAELQPVRKELEDARRKLDAVPLAANSPPAVNPDEYNPHHAESGEFSDGKALTFGFDHMIDHPGAYATLSPRRCTVVTPSGVTTSATGLNRYFQYPQEFENAPAVRPGLYRFELEGQLTNGEWAYITGGDHEVQPPPKTGLEVMIEDEKRTAFPGAAIVLEIDFRVTNHDPVPHLLRKSMRGFNRTSFPPPDDPDLIAAHREEQAVKDRRGRNGDDLPPRVQPGETVRGVYVTTFPWDPTGMFPDYTLVIKDERQAYTARPHGAGEDPLAAWPIT
jgi:hypothetical protein